MTIPDQIIKPAAKVKLPGLTDATAKLRQYAVRVCSHKRAVTDLRYLNDHLRRDIDADETEIERATLAQKPLIR